MTFDLMNVTASLVRASSKLITYGRFLISMRAQLFHTTLRQTSPCCAPIVDASSDYRKRDKPITTWAALSARENETNNGGLYRNF